MAVKLISLNVNGLNSKKTQKLLFDFIKEKNLHLICLQEHNIKDKNNLLGIYYEHFEVILNESINLKGGTAILIDKSLSCKQLQVEKSPCSRITSVKFVIGENRMHLLNIYAPSGSKFLQEREQMFKQDILYYLRNNLSNTIMCGDFNCVLNQRDKSKKGSCPISKGLLATIKNLELKDMWNVLKGNYTEFTYFRENYGSRLDRVYAAEFGKNLTNIVTKAIPFSDHHGVIIDINLNMYITMGKFYWKLNTKLLDDEFIEDEFRSAWNIMLRDRNKYENINEWWEISAKTNICNFF